MKKLIYLIMIMPMLAFSQPMLFENEFNLQLSNIKCYNSFKCLNSSKISVSIAKGTIGDVQTSIIYRLSGNDTNRGGSIGGQVWIKIAENNWIGFEGTSSLQADLDHDLFYAMEIKRKYIHIFPYVAIKIKSERIASFGVKAYYSHHSLGAEIKLSREKADNEGKFLRDRKPLESELSIQFGTQFETKALNKVFELLGVKKEDK